MKLERIHLLAQSRMVDTDLACCIQKIFEETGIDPGKLLTHLSTPLGRRRLLSTCLGNGLAPRFGFELRLCLRRPLRRDVGFGLNALRRFGVCFFGHSRCLRVDDDHAHGLARRARKCSDFGMLFNFISAWGRRGLVSIHQARIRLSYPPAELRDLPHRLAGDERITHVMQLVDTLLQQAVERWRQRNTAFADRRQQGFEVVA